MQVQSVRFEDGSVYLPEAAPWLGTYLTELLGFPNTKHDDQVDSTSQFLNWAWKRAGTHAGSIAVVAPVLVVGDDLSGDGYF